MTTSEHSHANRLTGLRLILQLLYSKPEIRYRVFRGVLIAKIKEACVTEIKKCISFIL